MEEIYKEFDDYVSRYNMSLDKLKLKYNHSYRVMSLQSKYSKIIGFNDEEVKLSSIIGLLHDIGRFRQYKLYSTFSDLKSVDHADLGSKILFDEGLIKKFWDNEEDYKIIDFSIRNHNKYTIEETKDEELLKHAKLIRDTDKLDILYLMGTLREYNYKTCDIKLSPKIIETIYNHKPVNLRDINNPNDARATYFAFAFDINNIETLNELKINLKNFYNYVNHEGIYDDIYNEINKYIDERVDKNVRKKVQSLRS